MVQRVGVVGKRLKSRSEDNDMSAQVYELRIWEVELLYFQLRYLQQIGNV